MLGALRGSGSVSGSPLVMDPANYQALSMQRRSLRDSRTLGNVPSAGSRLSTTQGDNPEAAMMNADAVGRQRMASAMGSNPNRGLGISGVLRRGVFTPGPRLADVPGGPMEMPERRSVVGAVPMSDMSTADRTRKLSAMGNRYGFNPTDPVSSQPINASTGTMRAPVGREALIRARVESGDLSPERAAEINANRQAYLGEQAERQERVRQRGIARGQLREGIVMGDDGRMDLTASMIARGGVLQNPLMAAQMGIQREMSAVEGRRQQTLADARLAQAQGATAEGAVPPLTPDQQRDQRIASGIELDELDDYEFTTRVGAVLMDTLDLPPEQQMEALRRNGIRPDHLQRIVGMRDPSIWNLWGAGSAINDTLFRDQTDLNIEEQVRGRAEEMLRQMGVGASGTTAPDANVVGRGASTDAMGQTMLRRGRVPVMPAGASPLRGGAATNPLQMRLDLPY